VRHGFIARSLLGIIASRAVAVLGPGAGSSRDLPAIREGNCAARRKIGTVASTKAFYRELIARLHRIFSPALSVKHIRRSALKRPVHDFAVLAFYVHIEINVGIHELHPGDDANQRDRFFIIELHDESVVREDGNCSEQQNKCQAKANGRNHSHRRTPRRATWAALVV
jgi:hypothetical protein